MGAAAAPHPSRSILEIDLRAIVANWRALGARLAQGATCAGVVKADLDYRKSYDLRFVNKGVGLSLRPKN